MHGEFWPTVKSNTFHVKLLWLLFWATIKTMGLLFTFASGHSAHKSFMYHYWVRFID